ncbi:hypothetical protein BAE44_0000413 [Dichanthelium oligosanthes]|uniref:F-box associated domain-containing protein n=1 Tax=Dichanthelium oligosanthes TaxID=888268 RepID=A0A1E5WN38_9POAL|nr:hypothetical protein BAE44_0000413 [Dichanthelium oligosanthes]
MLAFDTSSETFRLMSRPPETTERPGLETMRDLLDYPSCICILDGLLDGELSVATKQFLTLDIWVLPDYEGAAQIWALRHRVALPPPTDFGLVGNTPTMGRALPVGSSAILIGSPSARMATLYDLKEEGAQHNRLWGFT